MKRSPTILLVCFSVALHAQDIKEMLTKLKTPASPASVVIGIQPSSISRPKSWQAMEAAIYSNYFSSNGNFAIPNDFAIEFTPYWATKRTDIPVEEFAVPTVPQSLLQNLSFSISSTQNFLIKDSLSSDAMGIGLRTMLWQGTKREVDVLFRDLDLVRAKEAISNIVAQTAEKISSTSKAKFIDELIAGLEKRQDELVDSAPIYFTKASMRRWLSELRDVLTDSLPDGETDYRDELSDTFDKFTGIDSDAERVEAMVKDRQGFRLEFAAALALNFPTNQVNVSYAPKFSIWLTPSFQPIESDHFEFLGLLRYSWLDDSFYKKYGIETDFFQHTFDYGTRLVYKFDRFSFDVELVGRSSKVVLNKVTDGDGITTIRMKHDTDFQYLANLNYRISDQFILSYNFGSQFRPVLAASNQLISLLTLNLGIGGPKTDDVQGVKTGDK